MKPENKFYQTTAYVNKNKYHTTNLRSKATYIHTIINDISLQVTHGVDGQWVEMDTMIETR